MSRRTRHDRIRLHLFAIRVRNLLRFGILEKTSFPEVPPRVEFSFTPFGERLTAILDQVSELQQEWAGPPEPQAPGGGMRKAKT